MLFAAADQVNKKLTYTLTVVLLLLFPFEVRHPKSLVVFC